MAAPNNQYPSFFKVFIPSRSSQRLQLPVAFSAYVKQQTIPNNALLRNRHGKLWPVEVAKVGKDLFFQGGWERLVQDNTLEFGDFLVFEYDGDHTFDFLLFGRSTCEKDGVGTSDHPNVKEEEEEEDEEISEEDEEFDEQEEEDEEISEEDEEFDEQKEEEEDDDDDDDEDFDEKKEWEEEEEETTTKKKPKTCLNHAKGPVKVENNKSEVENEDDDVIFETGKYCRPNNPYFVTKMRRTRKNELYVPLDVIKDFDLKFGEKIILRDEQGRGWPADVVEWKDGRIWLTGGWKAFCKWNYVKEKDKCICEFVQDDQRHQQMLLKIQIARAGTF